MLKKGGWKKLPQKSRRITTIYIPQEKFELMDKLEAIARREYKDLSPLIMQAIEDYVKTHAEGNPAYAITKWVDDADFKVTPAFYEQWQKWKLYLSKCDRKELTEAEKRAINIREESHKNYMEPRHLK
jgi:hypothetical protein